VKTPGNSSLSYSQEDLDAFLERPSRVSQTELIAAALGVRFVAPQLGAASVTLVYLASTVGTNSNNDDPLRYTTHLTNALIAIAITRCIRSVQFHLAHLSKHKIIRMFHRPQETGGYRPGIDLSPLAMMASEIERASLEAQATWQLTSTQGNLPYHATDLESHISAALLRKSLLLRGATPDYVEAVMRGEIPLGHN
jgi:hypothetical protein